MSSNKQILSQNGEKKAYFLFFFNKTQMFKFYHCSNFDNVCVELKMPLPTDFAADSRYRSQSLLAYTVYQSSLPTKKEQGQFSIRRNR